MGGTGASIEVWQSKQETKHDDPHHTVEAIVWRHQYGAKWRAIPAELES